MTQPTLTRGQKAAADAFFDFLMTADRTFAISGTAGVGKTFLMSHIANDVMKLYEQSCTLIGAKPEFTQVVFTATTNKAAEVLSEALGTQVQTIHSWLGLKPKENFKTGKMTLERTNNWRVRRNLILFIDECSMIDKALYAEIMEACPQCKIVFVGDHAQMAPVGESLSEVYLRVAPENTAVLTEPVRNAGQPALVALCTQLRDTVETGIFRPIQLVPGVIERLDDTSMPALLTETFADLNPPSRVLCYTNTRVQSYNEFIREDVRNLDPGLHPGDIMIVAQAWSLGQLSLSVEQELEVVSVGELLQDSTWQGEYGVTFAYRDVTVRAPGSDYEGFVVPVAEDTDLVAKVVKHMAKQREWGDYFSLKGTFVDLRDKASCTVYKAQGSTYDSVFIDLGNIGTSYDAEQVARMLFVAVSRARSRVYLYGTLPSRYHDSKGRPLWQPAPLRPTSSSTSPDLSESASTSSLGF